MLGGREGERVSKWETPSQCGRIDSPVNVQMIYTKLILIIMGSNRMRHIHSMGCSRHRWAATNTPAQQETAIKG